MLSPKQKAIIKLMQDNDGKTTKAEAVILLQSQYYCNAEKYVGDILSRMVRIGLIDRVKNGVFEISKKTRNNGAEIDPKQLNLL